MNHISSHVSEILQKNNTNHWKFVLIQQWHNIIGSLADKVSIYKIQENQITLAVNDTSWMQELHLLSELIKEKINTTLGAQKINKIILKYNPQCKTRKKTLTPTKTNTVQHILNSSESQAIAKITDQELAQALLGFLQKCHQF